MNICRQTDNAAIYPSLVCCSYQLLQTSFSAGCGSHKCKKRTSSISQRLVVWGKSRHCPQGQVHTAFMSFYVFFMFSFLPPHNVSLLLPLNCSVNFQKPVKSPSLDRTGSKVRGRIYPNYIGLFRSGQALNPASWSSLIFTRHNKQSQASIVTPLFEPFSRNISSFIMCQ